MNVHELIAQVASRVPEGASVGTRHRAEAVLTAETTHRVVVAARIDAKGRRRELYLCDGAGLERHVLLRLTCAESECPQARAVRAQWRAFRQRGGAGSRRPATAAVAEPLIRDVPLSVAGHRCVARPARFPCFTACPNLAHPPIWIEKSGYDLFEDGVCIGGGLSSRSGASQPQLPDLPAAEAYLLARHLEARALRGIMPGQRLPD